MYKFLLFILFSFNCHLAKPNISLPNLVGSNMVLQQKEKLQIWGYGTPNEKVVIKFVNKIFKGVTQSNGKWAINIGKYIAGGPFTMEIIGNNTISLTNILIGEVWIASGQSNMEWPLWAANNEEEEIKNANYSNIRLFAIARSASPIPLDTCKGKWQTCSPDIAKYFSAVGYFFARRLALQTNVPIGIISATYGGTMAECWLPLQASLNSNDTKEDAKDLENLYTKYNTNAVSENAKWLADLDFRDSGIVNGKLQYIMQFNNDWDSIIMPKYWDNNDGDLKEADGIVYLQKQFLLTEADLKNSVWVNLAPIDDEDFTYVNGIHVGATKSSYYRQRHYYVPDSILKIGANTITIRIIDYLMGGGLNGTAKQMYVQTKNSNIPIDGFWKYKIGLKMKNTTYPAAEFHVNKLPSLLFNAMINPITSYKCKGVIWYQGESNASNASKYEATFTTLIKSWRENFKNKKMPFYFVQLANFFEPNIKPSSSSWAQIRQSQASALQLKNTGMATAIDIGDATTIHPKNKQDVGLRLANIALYNNYGFNTLKPFSPNVIKVVAKNDSVFILSIINSYNGLQLKDASLPINSFEANYADSTSEYVEAKIYSPNKIILNTKSTKKVVTIKYAWANNPGFLNVYNSENLPLLPFSMAIKY